MTSRLVWWLALLASTGMLAAAVLLAPTPSRPHDFGTPVAGSPTSAVGAEDGQERQPGQVPTGERRERASSPGQPQGGRERAAEPAREGSPAARAAAPVVGADARRPATAATPAATARPVRVAAPVIGLDARVVPVGVDGDGQMAIPDSGRDVGWYRYGATPGGATGTAVLASHVSTREEGAGVLAGLAELRDGDRLTVDLAGSAPVGYRVTARQTVPKAALQSSALFDREGPPRLALVTCGGPWDDERGRYRDNVIVLAEPVRPAG